MLVMFLTCGKLKGVAREMTFSITCTVIDFFSPLVREKLDLEDIAMASIQSKQDETDEELRQTMKRLEATQQKTKEAKALAARERTLIKQDVDIIRNLLNEVRYILSKCTYNHYEFYRFMMFSTFLRRSEIYFLTGNLRGLFYC